MMWTYAAPFNGQTNAVVRTNADGSMESCSINAPEIQAWLADGNTPDPYVPPAPPPVTSVTPRQARLALFGAGLLDQVNTMITAQGGANQITWEYATTIERMDPLIVSLGAALNLTSAQIDALFTQASTL